MSQLCDASVPVLGRLAVCTRPHDHEGEHEARLVIERTKPSGRSSTRVYSITWGPGRPVQLGHDPSIANQRKGGK
jgi:hypothetical protein